MEWVYVGRCASGDGEGRKKGWRERGREGRRPSQLYLTSILILFTLMYCQLSVPKAMASSATDTTAHIVAKDSVMAEQGMLWRGGRGTLKETAAPRVSTPLPHRVSQVTEGRGFLHPRTCPPGGGAMKGETQTSLIPSYNYI